MTFINIAGYKFLQLTHLNELQAELLAHAVQFSCKGTILLSDEGININLSAQKQNIESFKHYLQTFPDFQDITFRTSISNAQPFKFMRVKIKEEIITMHQKNIQPQVKRAKSLSPQTLKKWLDENRDVTLLDTRNAYEIEFGTFKNATHL